MDLLTFLVMALAIVTGWFMRDMWLAFNWEHTVWGLLGDFVPVPKYRYVDLNAFEKAMLSRDRSIQALTHDAAILQAELEALKKPVVEAETPKPVKAPRKSRSKAVGKVVFQTQTTDVSEENKPSE